MKAVTSAILLLSSLLGNGYAFGQKLSFQDAEYRYDEIRLSGYLSQVFGVRADSIREPALYLAIEPWLGVPYQYAGKSKKGIDCSGFSSVIYNQVYCTPLSGGSHDIFKRVDMVEKSDLQEGDLVFFRINPKYTVSHVGVYLGEGRFAHASVKKGVIVSHLDEPYYKKYFKSGGRIRFN
jgi:lipoprotein Spr